MPDYWYKKSSTSTMNSLITSLSAPKILFYLFELSSSIPHCIVASLMSFVILLLGVRIYFSQIMIWGLNFGAIFAMISFFLLLQNECPTTYSTNMFFMTVHWVCCLYRRRLPINSPLSYLSSKFSFIFLPIFTKH